MDSKKYIRVEGNSGLVRDRETGAILNANVTEIQKARLKKLSLIHISEPTRPY